ncbi:hypothetical protein E2C01_036851 [Portunus trituberculatus]|uniref:Uncharacterized protein n=1 Tax=Portunus trituberculatus TaxID=210409 RepID=A0A5B7F7S8_PORTR|nr:hypothetical protein [Portunus trituberculatus]
MQLTLPFRPRHHHIRTRSSMAERWTLKTEQQLLFAPTPPPIASPHPECSGSGGACGGLSLGRFMVRPNLWVSNYVVTRGNSWSFTPEAPTLAYCFPLSTPTLAARRLHPSPEPTAGRRSLRFRSSRVC